MRLTGEIEATRVERGVYKPSVRMDEVSHLRLLIPVVQVYPLILDPPLLRGDVSWRMRRIWR